MMSIWQKYNYSDGYAKHFATIGEGTYRPAHLGIEKQKSVNVNASRTKGLTFKNERGVPLIVDKENNTLTFVAFPIL